MIKKKYKEECDLCHIAKVDCHGFYDADNKAYILCPECAKELIEKKTIVRDWKGQIYETTTTNCNSGEERGESKEEIQSEGNKDTGDFKNECEDKGQLLHGRVSGREKSSEHNIGQRVRTRKTKLI